MSIAHRHLYCTVSHQLCNRANINALHYQSRSESVPVAVPGVVLNLRQLDCRLEPGLRFAQRRKSTPASTGSLSIARPICAGTRFTELPVGNVQGPARSLVSRKHRWPWNSPTPSSARREQRVCLTLPAGAPGAMNARPTVAGQADRTSIHTLGAGFPDRSRSETCGRVAQGRESSPLPNLAREVQRSAKPALF